MVDFFQTGMGRKFYESTMPRIAKALEDLAKMLSMPKTLDEMNRMFQALAIVDKKIYSAMSVGQVAREIMDAPLVDSTHPILLDYTEPENAKLLDVVMVGRKTRWDVTVLKGKTETLEDARKVVANYLCRVEKLGADVELIETAYEENVGGWTFRLEHMTGYESDSGDDS